MRYVVVGLGNIGRRRAALLGERCVATVDPVAPAATHRRLEDVAAERYDAAVLATPNAVKLDYLTALLALGKSALVEKPLPLPGRAQAEALQRRTRPGVIWYTSYNHRYEPLIVRLRARLADGDVGNLDRVRMVYGNGTVRNWIGTWRETGTGVLEDLGCHLIDLAGFLLPGPRARWELLDLRSVESATFDYGLLASVDRRVLLEIGNVFWKNCFRVDVYGDAGSLHLEGLGKWGGAALIHRRRTLPSGAPVETREETGAGDPTWAADVAEFEAAVAVGRSSFASDWAVSEALASLTRQARLGGLGVAS